MEVDGERYRCANYGVCDLIIDVITDRLRRTFFRRTMKNRMEKLKICPLMRSSKNECCFLNDLPFDFFCFQMKQKVSQLEKQSLDEKPWQLKGEVSAAKRPYNSLLEEDLDFETAARLGM